MTFRLTLARVAGLSLLASLSTACRADATLILTLGSDGDDPAPSDASMPADAATSPPMDGDATTPVTDAGTSDLPDADDGTLDDAGIGDAAADSAI